MHLRVRGEELLLPLHLVVLQLEVQEFVYPYGKISIWSRFLHIMAQLT